MIIFFLTYSVLHFSFQAIVIFNADQHEEAFLRIQKLAAACPNDDIIACHVVEVSVLIKPMFRASILISLNFPTSGLSTCSARNQCLE
jgi:hypothetical protein